MDTIKVFLLTLVVIFTYGIAGKGECDSLDDKYLIVRGCTETPKGMNKNAPIVVQWIRVTQDDMPIVCARVIGSVFPIPGTTGCYGWKNNICYVYADDTPEGMATLGHEVKHCYDGLFHNTTDWEWLEQHH